MKKRLLTIMVLLFPGSMQAQTFSMSPDTSWAAGDTSVYLLNCYAHIHNPSNDTLWLTWQRTFQSLPSGWSASVCDELLCYPPGVDSGSVSVLPNDSSLLAVQYYTFGQQGSGEMHVVVYDTQDSVATATKTVYIGTITVSSVGEHPVNSFAAFPNPTRGPLTVAGNRSPGHPVSVRVYNLQLQKVLEDVIPAGSSTLGLDLSNLPGGLYQVIMGYGEKSTITRVVKH